MKYSRQRELVLQAVRENPIHPTADQVYHILKKDNPQISLATVYRNLNLLSQTGQIVKIPLPNQGDRFDGHTVPHYHMLCQQCGQVFDLQLSLLDGLDEQIQASTGFAVTGHQLIVTGYCPHCQQADAGSTAH